MYFKSRVLSSLLLCITLLIAAPVSIASQEAVDPELFCKQWTGRNLQAMASMQNSGAKEEDVIKSFLDYAARAGVDGPTVKNFIRVIVAFFARDEKEFIKAIDDTVASCTSEVKKRQTVEL